MAAMVQADDVDSRVTNHEHLNFDPDRTIYTTHLIQPTYPQIYRSELRFQSSPGFLYKSFFSPYQTSPSPMGLDFPSLAFSFCVEAT
jgi:hypothetical protein